MSNRLNKMYPSSKIFQWWTKTQVSCCCTCSIICVVPGWLDSDGGLAAISWNPSYGTKMPADFIMGNYWSSKLSSISLCLIVVRITIYLPSSGWQINVSVEWQNSSFVSLYWSRQFPPRAKEMQYPLGQFPHSLRIPKFWQSTCSRNPSFTPRQ